MWNEAEMLIEGQQLIKLFGKALTEISEDFGLNKTELSVLLFLAENPDRDTAKDIVENRMLAKSCVSKAIDSLERQGYLEVKEDRADRRILHLKVQPTAMDVIVAGQEIQQEMIRQVGRGISAEEKKLFFEVYQKMVQNIKEYHGKKQA